MTESVWEAARGKGVQHGEVDRPAGRGAGIEATPWPDGEIRHAGLVLRPWTLHDVRAMIGLFDTAEIDRWTPLPHPFDAAAATRYVLEARRGLPSRVQLAVTERGGTPLGEVLLFTTEHEQTCELAYAIGAEHRGQGWGARSVCAMLPVARATGYVRARLRIAVENVPSQRVAARSGFDLSDEPLLRRERKGYVLELATWSREL